MSEDLGKQILKGVSRSFYLTLRLLPAPMRDAASLGYLLARTSDTIADTEAVPVKIRRDLLMDFADTVGRGDPLPSWPDALTNHVTPEENRLLENTPRITAWLRGIHESKAKLIREVVATIIGGQLMDLQRFENATAAQPVALPDDFALDEYTWCVAGCVGAFWTKLGFLTLGENYSTEPETNLLEKGIAYGKGLQLVNILRDLPRDLAAGRCYLPVADPSDPSQIMAEFQKWHAQATTWVAEGIACSKTLRSRRLRAATVLPALIAEETLGLLAGVSWEKLQTRVKLPRRRIYRLLVESLLF